MIVLVGWLAALVAAGLILGIVGFGLSGQLTRLRRAMNAVLDDVRPRALDLLAVLPRQESAGERSAERQRNNLD
ncbi:MAG: hypothetical protein M3500_09780 [Actinomycetota bacterium]|nr:hypothetical protein [Actinomycetota bacterium]